MYKTDEIINTTPQKKKSAGKKAVITILVILLIPVILAGLLVLYLNVADFRYDDPQEIIAQNPMSFSERNSFDAGNSTRTMRLDKSDIYFLTKDKIPDLHLSESIYINAYRIALDESAIYLQGKAYGINIPVKLCMDVGYKSGNVLLHVKGAWLGRLGIPLPLDYIADKAGTELDYSISIKDVPEINEADELFLKDGYINAVYPVNKNIVQECIIAWPYLRPAAFYLQEKDEMVGLIEDFQENRTVDGYKSERLNSFMKGLEKEPGKYQELKIRMLATAPEKSAEKFFSSKEYSSEIFTRFYPGITKQAVDLLRDQIHYSRNYLFIKTFALDIDKKFKQKAIKVSNGSFVDTRSGRKLDLYDVYKGYPEMKEVFPEGTKLCAVKCESYSASLITNRSTYGCGTAVEFPGGRCAVISVSEGKAYFMEIEPKEFSDIQSGKEKVYIYAF
jgi:hypothetical protein